LPDEVFAGAIVHTLKRDALLGQPDNVVKEFQNGLLGAIATMGESASVVWRNQWERVPAKTRCKDFSVA
jgi:hypothetical protein